MNPSLKIEINALVAVSPFLGNVSHINPAIAVLLYNTDTPFISLALDMYLPVIPYQDFPADEPHFLSPPH